MVKATMGAEEYESDEVQREVQIWDFIAYIYDVLMQQERSTK
jgi:hypothetical protein